METTILSEQRERIIKPWSHTVVGNVTLLAMLTLVLLALGFGRLSMSSALALGSFTGFVIAAINWFRLGRRWRGLFHLLISPAIYLIIRMGIPLLLAAILSVLSGGSADRVAQISGDSISTFVLILDFGAGFLVIAYLYSTIKRDIMRLQTNGVVVKYGGSSLPVGIATLSIVLMWGANTVAGQVHVTSIQNHIYCELLQPGMTEEEVGDALATMGPNYQLEVDESFHLPSAGAASYRLVSWRDRTKDYDWNYNLWLWLGYDREGHLMWRGHEWAVINSGDMRQGFDTVECPWTLSQSVAAH